MHFSDFHILDLELSFTGWLKWLRRSSFQFLEIFGIEWNAFDSNEREWRRSNDDMLLYLLFTYSSKSLITECYNGRFHTLFRKLWNFDKMFGASYFSSKITSTARIWAAYTLRRRRYWRKYSWTSLWKKYLIKCKILAVGVIFFEK